MIINEFALRKLIQCPLFDPAPPTHSDICAKELTRWALRESFNNKFTGEAKDIAHRVRGAVLDFWTGDKKEVGTLARTVAFRLFSLITDYKVIHLEQPYELVLNGNTIQGEYALLRKRIGEKLPYILILHTEEPAYRHDQILPPNIITLARYLHLHTSTNYNDAQILHYPVFRGKSWLNKTVNHTLAKTYLCSMLEVAQLHPQYPVLGDHCKGCVTKPCLEVFKTWIK